MYTLMTVLRKRPEVSTEDFRHFMEHDYGPAYVSLPQVRHYVQRYVTDLTAAPEPIDAAFVSGALANHGLSSCLLDVVDTFVGCRNRDPHLTALRRIFDGIVHQVGAGLGDQAAIAFDRRRR